jgi:cell shape-determining protein MreD
LRLVLLFATFALLGLAFESALPQLISFRSLIPNLIVILAVDLGLRHHSALAAMLAFAMGYATDALSGSTPGLNAFMVTLVYLVSYEISTRLLVTTAPVGATVVFFGVLATGLGSIAISAGFAALFGTGWMMLALALQAAISALAAPFIFALLAGSKRLTRLPVGPARE